MWGEFGTPAAARRVRVREAFGVGHRRRLHRRLPTMVQPTPGGMVRLWKRLGSASWHGYAMRSPGTRSSTLSSARPAQSCRVPGHDAGRRPVHREDSRERHSAHRGARGRIPDRRRRSRRHHRRAGHDSVAERAGAPNNFRNAFPLLAGSGRPSPTARSPSPPPMWGTIMACRSSSAAPSRRPPPPIDVDLVFAPDGITCYEDARRRGMRHA